MTTTELAIQLDRWATEWEALEPIRPGLYYYLAQRLEEAKEGNLSDVLIAMVAHTTCNPTHGFNCSCKDKYLRAARRMLTPGMLDELRYLMLVVTR